MAQKRMFDRAVIETDKFLNVSLSAKAIYFLLGMEADDEGFVSPKRVLRLYGGEIGDLKNLIDVGLVIPFESGVVVITDWGKNNWLDARRIKATEYQTEKKLLAQQGGKYVLLSNGLASAQREESSIEESSIVNTPASPAESGPLKSKNKIMKNSFRYDESKSSDSFEDVIDDETGTLKKSVPKGNHGKLYKVLLDWAIGERGSPFVSLPKQFKAMEKMRIAGIPPIEIKNRWIELSQQDYYKQHGLDFMSVASSFDRKPVLK